MNEAVTEVASALWKYGEVTLIHWSDYPILQSNAMTPALIDDRVFESAAKLFRVLSTPIRLKIIGAVCDGERNVTELLGVIPTTQSNLSQHLAMLYGEGILGKRREGNQIYYRLQSEQVATICRTVCSQVAGKNSRKSAKAI